MRPGRILQGGNGRVGRGRGGPKARWGLGNSVEVAHPHVERRRNGAEQHRRRRAVRGQGERCPPVLAPTAAVDDSPELAGDQLGAVADPQHRHPDLVHLGIEQRRARNVDGLGPTRQDDPGRRAGSQLGGGDACGARSRCTRAPLAPAGRSAGRTEPRSRRRERGWKCCPGRSTFGPKGVGPNGPSRCPATAGGPCPRSAERGRPSPRPSGTP